jgi:hypothetical protein
MAYASSALVIVVVTVCDLSSPFTRIFTASLFSAEIWLAQRVWREALTSTQFKGKIAFCLRWQILNLLARDRFQSHLIEFFVR